MPIVTTLRTATVHDLPGVYRVCLRTGLAGHEASDTYSDPDLLPRVQGEGWGRRLLDAVTDRLAAVGAGGVHLGVDEANTAAQAFYRRVGFTELSRTTGARYFGGRLGPS